MKGYISDYDSNTDTLYIAVPLHGGIDSIREAESDEVDVVLTPSALITPQQRRKIFSLIHDIADYISGGGNSRNEIRSTLRAMQLNYLIDVADSEAVRFCLTDQYCRLQGIDLFSLSPRNENCASKEDRKSVV